MTDKYKDLRDALAAGPTPGPWVAKNVSGAGLEIHMQAPEPNQERQWPAFSTRHADIKDGLVAYEQWVQFPTEKLEKIQTRTALFIAAANPEAIRALLEERDTLRGHVAELIAICEPNLYPCPDKSDSKWAKLIAAKAALAQGEKHDKQD